MPEFTIALTGVTVEEWNDPPTATTPSRLNPYPERAARRYVGTVGSEIVIAATMNGDDSFPTDASLGGKLFVFASAEAPHPWPVAFTLLVAGFSAVQRFTPTHVGHYLVYVRREGSGMYFAHIDVEDAE